MLTSIIEKIRALIADLGNSTDNESWSYSSSLVFKIATPNAAEPTSVLLDGVTLGSNEWSYDTTTQEITLTPEESAVSGDTVQANFTSYKYSDTELTAYVRAALVYLGIFSQTSNYDYEIEDGTDIVPSPSNKECDLIALVASILIKPDWEMYKTPTLEVRYMRKYDKDDKIQMLIDKCRWGIGLIDILTFD